MNVTIEIPEERVERFQREAHARGLKLDQWLLELAEENAPSCSISDLQRSDPAEWARHFHEWAESHDRTTPLLSDEAVSRETLYSDRL